MMKWARALAPLLLAVPAVASASPIGSDAAACTSGGPAIQVSVEGLKDRRGRLKLELYPANEADFLKDDTLLIREGKLFRRVWADTPASGPVTMCIRVPHAGSYALLFTHDRDGKNKFSLTQDGAGFVSAGKLGRSRPKLAQATLQVGGGVTRVTIRAQYLRGLSGFGPLSG